MEGRRRLLGALGTATAAALAGCSSLGGGDGATTTTPEPVTGLDVDCSELETLPNPPYSRLRVVAVGDRVQIGLDKPFPGDGGLYVKRNGDPVEGFAPVKTVGRTTEFDASDSVTLVLKRDDGTCGRWRGEASELDV